jgi:hypothetical protein
MIALFTTFSLERRNNPTGLSDTTIGVAAQVLLLHCVASVSRPARQYESTRARKRMRESLETTAFPAIRSRSATMSHSAAPKPLEARCNAEFRCITIELPHCKSITRSLPVLIWRPGRTRSSGTRTAFHGARGHDAGQSLKGRGEIESTE